MKKYTKESYQLLLFAAFILFSYSTKAQKTVGIGTINNLNSNAVLHLVAPDNDQGFLVPGLTTSQRTAASFTSKLSTNDNGLLVFDQDERKFYFWKENAWVALIGTDVGSILSSGIGININDNNQIENTGDVDSTDDITVGTTAGGVLNGTYPNPGINNNTITRQKIANDAVDRDKIAANVAGSGLNQNADGSLEINAGNGLEINEDALQLTNTGVTSGTFGTINMVPQLIVDEMGRISGITELPITVSPTGAAGGELSGTYPNPTISDDVIDSANIKTGSIITENLADESVTADKLASQSVDISKINPGANNEKSILTTNNSNNLLWFKPGNDQVLVTSSDGQIISEDRSNFETNTLPHEEIFVGDGTGSARPVPVTGDIEINSGGEVTIQPDAITSIKIAENAVGTDEISDGAVNTSDLANGSVSEQKIADDAVTLEKLAGGTGNQLLTTDGSGNPQYESKSDVFNAMAGEGLAENAGMLDVQVDDATLEIATDVVQVKNEGITTDKIADDAVDLDKIAHGGADQVLTTNGAGEPQYENKSDIFNAMAGEGLAENAGMLDVQVDDATLEIVTDVVQVKDGGITNDKIADDDITSAKIEDQTIVDADINTNADIGRNKLADGTPGHVIINDESTGLLSSEAQLSISRGGTGADNPSDARNNLGLGTVATQDAAAVDIEGGNIDNTSIGTTTPSDATFTDLQVSNSFTLSAGASVNEIVTSIGGSPSNDQLATAAAISNFLSDSTLKKEIEVLQNALLNISKIQGVTYKWKNTAWDSSTQIGVIAQNLEDVYPQLVNTNEEGHKTVNYIGMIPILIEAIKEQQRTIQQLTEENRAIKSDLEMIKAALGLDKKVAID